jgi:hypothetical protein
MSASPLHLQSALPGVRPAVPVSALSGLFGDRIAARNHGLPASVVERSAEAYEALHESLAGCASNLGGGRSGALWRDLTSAERPLTLEWLVYLASMPAAEPRAAVRRVLAVVQAAIDARHASGTIAGRSADAASAATELLGLVARAQEDGEITADERAQLRRAAIPLQQAVAAVESLLNDGGAR